MHRRFFSNAGDADDRSYAALSSVVREIEGKDAWLADSHTAFRRALRGAIARLDEYFPPSKAGYADREKRRVAEILFGYRRHELAPSADKMPLTGQKQREFGAHDYLEAARQALHPGLSERTYERAFTEIRIDLARILQGIATEAAARRALEAAQTKAVIARSYREALDYIRRDAIYDEIDTAVRAGRRVIGLVGDGGVGKSTLARRYAAEKLAGTSAMIFADFRSLERLTASLRQSFRDIGWGAEGVNAQSALARLDEAIASRGQFVQAIILDNLSEPEQINLLVSLSHYRGITLITTRDAAILPTEATAVAVGDLADREAEAAIRLKLPDCTSDEFSALSRLRGRILAIDIACAFMRNRSTIARHTFTEHLRLSTVNAVSNAAAIQGRPTLERLYRDILRSLESDEYTAAAVRVLEIQVASTIVLCTCGRVDDPSVVFTSLHNGFDITRSRLGVAQISEAAFYRYLAAIEILQRFHIIQPGRYPVARGERGTFFYTAAGDSLDVHPLSLEIFQSIFRERIPDLCYAMMAQCLEWHRRYLREIDSYEHHKRLAVAHTMLNESEYLAKTAKSGAIVTGSAAFDEIMQLAREMRSKAVSIHKENAPHASFSYYENNF